MREGRRVAVITGGSSGIGRRVAEDLAARGWCVCVAARREQVLREVVSAIGGPAAGHSHVTADVSTPDGIDAIGRQVDEAYGRCDVLVNSAGFSRRTPFTSHEAVGVVAEVMATNFHGAVRCTWTLLPLLRRSAPSTVVNIASVAGRFPVAGSPAYAASKFALVGWSESVRGELEELGVHVGLVEPGPLPTEGFPQAALREHPLGRLATTDVARVSRAVLEVIAFNRDRRTVPRIYYLPQILQSIIPGPTLRVAQRVLAARQRREEAAPTDGHPSSGPRTDRHLDDAHDRSTDPTVDTAPEVPATEEAHPWLRSPSPE